MNDLSNREISDRLFIHTVMFFLWFVIAVITIVFRDRLTWVVGATAIIYLALDEFANVFFFWKERYRRISGTHRKADDVTTTK